MADNTRTAEALSALTEGIAALGSTAAWKQYLDAARLFHRVGETFDARFVQRILPTSRVSSIDIPCARTDASGIALLWNLHLPLRLSSGAMQRRNPWTD